MNSPVRHWQGFAVKVKRRGKGQVDGVEREDMLRVVTLAEADKTIAGLRDAALISAHDVRLPVAN